MQRRADTCNQHQSPGDTHPNSCFVPNSLVSQFFKIHNNQEQFEDHVSFLIDNWLNGNLDMLMTDDNDNEE